jgi:hypothetical protein
MDLDLFSALDALNTMARQSIERLLVLDGPAKRLFRICRLTESRQYRIVLRRDTP